MIKKDLNLYFVRHGETYLNYYDRMQGWSDAPLTEKGIKDVRRSGRGLKDIKFDAIYTSDLARTIDTAKLILDENERTLSDEVIQPLPEFREIFFGSFEGEYKEIIYHQVAQHLGKENKEEMFAEVSDIEIMRGFKELDPYGDAEDFMELWLRVEKGLIHVVENHRQTSDNVLIVVHGGIIRLLLENLIPTLRIENRTTLVNASVSVLQFDNRMFHLDRFADTSHFKDV